MNDLVTFRDIFEDIEPFAGMVPQGYLVDFLGTLTDAKFRALLGIGTRLNGGQYVNTRLPQLSRDGEEWFEAVNWVMAAREARESFVMMTLGACYGAQAVGAYRALRLLNPMPYKLVAVEPVPENFAWTIKHFQDNAIDPSAHWLLPLAIAATNEPVYFPVGMPGSGSQNCFSTNERAARECYVRELLKGDPETALTNLLLDNTTGLTKDLLPGKNWISEIKLMSSITLRDLLAPFDVVDYVESDIQQSEILVFPPFMELLTKKVRRVHIGTHGADVHTSLHELFEQHGWEIVFSFPPNSTFDTPLGSFDTNDGVLTARNQNV